MPAQGSVKALLPLLAHAVPRSIHERQRPVLRARRESRRRRGRAAARVAQDLRRGLAPRHPRADARDRAARHARVVRRGEESAARPSTTRRARTPIPRRRSTCARASRRCARAGSPSAATPWSSTARRPRYGRERLADPALAGLRFDLHRAAAPRAKPAPTSRRCTTRAAASSRPRWSSSRSARTCGARRCSRRCPTIVRRQHPGPERSAPRSRPSITPEFVRDEVARGRAIIPANINHPESRADDHRPQLPGEDQRQHRQLGRVVVDRRGSREDDVGDPLGRATR